jgi:hypothetical protein
LRSDIYEKEYSVVTLLSPIGAFCSGRVGHASGRGLPVSGSRLRAVPDVFLAKIPPYAGHRDRRASLVLAQPPSGRAWRAGRTDDRRHRRFPRRGRAKMVGWPQFLYRCRSRVERAIGKDLLATDTFEKLVMCDEISWAFAGLSMPAWNAVLSALLCALWILALRRR